MDPDKAHHVSPVVSTLLIQDSLGDSKDPDRLRKCWTAKLTLAISDTDNSKYCLSRRLILDNVGLALLYFLYN